MKFLFLFFEKVSYYSFIILLDHELFKILIEYTYRAVEYFSSFDLDVL